MLVVGLVTAGCLTRDPLATTAREEPRPDVVHAWNPPAGADMTPNYEFVAAPDFLNQDVADARQLPTWKPGDPNSWTPQLEQYIDAFLDDIAATHPGSVLVAGDLVEGRWGRDYGDTGLFGPVDTDAQRAAAVRRAARFYYSAYVKRFTDRGLTLHAAVGDHDIGDNPWDDTSPWTTFKRQHIALFKRMFAKYLTRKPDGEPRYHDRPYRTSFAHTSYATMLSPDVLLVSLDEFHRRDGNVHLEVTGGQLAWLRNTLKKARADGVPWVIVQGHNPVLYPVREVSSSGGHIERGARSPLWRTMSRYGVDLYINGEVHATTMRRADGLTQVSTGGLLYRGQATYMIARVYDDRIDLDVRQVPGSEGGPKLWQTTGLRTRSGTRWDGSQSISIGTMTLTSNDRPVNQTGLLQEWSPGSS